MKKRSYLLLLFVPGRKAPRSQNTVEKSFRSLGVLTKTSWSTHNTHRLDARDYCDRKILKNTEKLGIQSLHDFSDAPEFGSEKSSATQILPLFTTLTRHAAAADPWFLNKNRSIRKSLLDGESQPRAMTSALTLRPRSRTELLLKSKYERGSLSNQQSACD